MKYTIEYLESVVESDIPDLAKSVRVRIAKAIAQRLAVHPIELSKPLRYSLKGARRFRVGDYRIIFVIEPPNTLVVVKIGYRREVYESL